MSAEFDCQPDPCYNIGAQWTFSVPVYDPFNPGRVLGVIYAPTDPSREACAQHILPDQFPPSVDLPPISEIKPEPSCLKGGEENVSSGGGCTSKSDGELFGQMFVAVVVPLLWFV